MIYVYEKVFAWLNILFFLLLVLESKSYDCINTLKYFTLNRSVSFIQII